MTLTAEIAWDTQLTGVFVLDESLLDGPDVLPGTFGNNTFDDMTDRLMAFTVSRGRTTDMGSVQSGQTTWLLSDEDGDFNPDNPGSPLAGLISDMRPMRLKKTHLGTQYGLFYGFISEIKHYPRWGRRVTEIRGVDFFEWLAGIKPIIASTGQTTVGAAIGLILDAAEWTDPAFRNLDTGDTIAGFSADGTQSGIQLIEELLKTDLGMVFSNGSGVVRYVERSSFYKRRAVDDTFSGEHVLPTLEPSLHTRNVVNRQKVTRSGGVEQEATNEDSRKKRGWRDGTPITSDKLLTDEQALNLAQWVVLVKGEPVSPVRNLEIPGASDVLLTKIMGAEITDLVAVSSVLGGTDTEGTIQRLSLDWAAEHGLLSGHYAVLKKALTQFTLDQSLLDSADVLGY